MIAAARAEIADERLRSLARRLADACPEELGSEIAATGSLGAGLADEYSDLELLLLADEVPAVDDVRAWLGSVGATDLLVGSEPDGVWAWCRVDGVEFEPFWTTIAAPKCEVDAVLAGEAIEHARLAVTHVLTHCVVLRVTAIEALAERCSVYPEGLAERLIADGLRGWEIPSARLGAALRGDRLSAEGFLVHDAQRILRIVFALNRTWEPPRWKWIRHWAGELERAPHRLVDRIFAALVEPDAVAAFRMLHELQRETLALLPAEVDAERAWSGTRARLAQLAEAGSR